MSCKFNDEKLSSLTFTRFHLNSAVFSGFDNTKFYERNVKKVEVRT